MLKIFRTEATRINFMRVMITMRERGLFFKIYYRFQVLNIFLSGLKTGTEMTLGTVRSPVITIIKTNTATIKTAIVAKTDMTTTRTVTADRTVTQGPKIVIMGHTRTTLGGRA